MGIYRRKDKNGRPHGPWIIQYPHRRDPLSGRVIYTTRTVGHSKRLAKRALAQKLLEWERKKLLGQEVQSPETVSDLMEWFLGLGEVKATTSYRSYVWMAKVVTRDLGRTPAAGLRPAAINAWRSRLLEQGLSAGTVNRLFSGLRRAYNLAVREGLLTRNPCWKLKCLPDIHDPRPVITSEQMARLLELLPEQGRIPVLLAYLTGMRKGEIVSLTWDQVDLAEEMIILPASKTKTRRHRIIPIPGPVLSWLREQGPGEAGELVFLSARGGPLLSLAKWFKKAAGKIGVQARFHDLRHSFVTLARQAGVERSVIKTVTGHATDHMFEHYNHVDQGDARQAVRTMERLAGLKDEVP